MSKLSVMTERVGAREAAVILGVTRRTVNRWAELGILPEAEKLDGKTGVRLFHRSTVELLANQRLAAKNKAA